MVRRLLVLGMTVMLQIAPAMAVISREIGGNAGTPGGGAGTPPSGPDLTDPGFAEEEPYRNPDMGPLGVVLSNGEFQLSVTDLEIPGRGMPVRLTRTYRSRKSDVRGILGFGWHLNYDEILTEGGYLDPYLGRHPAIQWTLGNGWRQLWLDLDGNGYRPFGGFYGKLRSLGSQLGYQIRSSDGTVKTFGQPVPSASGRPAWALSRIEDRNGNAISIQFRISPESGATLIDIITDTLGRAIRFSYDGSDRLASVTDFTGRRIDYAYDSFDDLVSAKSPEVTGTPNGNDFCDGGCAEPRKGVTYLYAAGDGCVEGALLHNLTGVVNGNGTLFLANHYFSAWDSRCGEVTGSSLPPSDFIKDQTYGGEVVGYAYRFLNPYNPGPETVVLETTVTDRNGNVQVHSFNKQGSPLRIVTRTNRGIRSLEGSDEGDYTVTYHYVDNGGGLVSSKTESGGMNVDASGRLVPYAEGMTTRYNYDESNPDIFQRGNLLSVVRTPDGERGEGQGSLVTWTAYEPLFNQPLTDTDLRGRVTTFTYDFQEGSYADLLAGSPPPAVDPAWWSAGEIESFLSEPGRSNLGDRNGDGYHRSGNAVGVNEGSLTHADGTTGGEITTTFAYNDFGQPMIRRDAEYNETHFFYFAEADPDGDGVPTPDPADGRSLAWESGPGGGGYLQSMVRDAPPVMPLPAPPPVPGRDNGQDPPPAAILSSFTYDPAGNVSSTTDGRGIRTDYLVNSLNQVVQVVRAAASADPSAPPFGYREQFRYDAANNLVQRRQERRDDGSTSPEDRWIVADMAYDGLDRKVAETLTTDDSPPLSLTTTFAYDGNGNLRKTVFPGGNAVLRFYDERDLLFREVALAVPSADLLDMDYDPSRDSVTRYDYDGAGDVIQITDPMGHTARNGYDGFDRKVVSFDPAFQKTVFVRDGAGDVMEQSTYGFLGGAAPSPAGPPAPAYPEISRVRFFHDEQGHVRRTDTRFFRYVGAIRIFLTTDSNAGLSASPDPDWEPVPAAGDGWTTSLARYDRLGREVLVTDDNGHSTETRYDGAGRRIQVLRNPVSPFVSSPGGPDQRNAVSTTYDADGNPVEFLETEWGSDRSDPTGPARMLPAQQYRTLCRYDSMNRKVEETVAGRVGSAPLSLTTRTVYDSRGARIRLTDPAGGRTKWFYDGLGRQVRTETGYHFDGIEETVPPSQINAANPDGLITTRLDYDAAGRLVAVTDDGGRTTGFAYDSLSRRTRVVYPDGSHRDVSFDRDSLAVRWEQAGSGGSRLAVSTTYDSLHRAVRRDVDSSAAPRIGGTRRQLFEYDGLGRMTLAVDDSDPADSLVDSTVSLAYNSLGKVVAETEAFQDPGAGQPVQGSRTVSSFYDGTGFRTRVIYPGGRNVRFIPDELNRLGSLVDSYTGTTRYDYLGPSRLLNRIGPNGTRLTFLSGPGDDLAAGYDAARRVAEFATRATGATAGAVAEFAYGYDGAGNKVFERRLHEPPGAGWGGRTYRYDSARRLVSWTRGDLDEGGSLLEGESSTRTLTLDGTGNWRLTRTDGRITSVTVNDLNQYTRLNGLTGSVSLAYDFSGNLVSETEASEDRTYTYDFAGRLASFLDSSSVPATYKYDALGRRISKRLSSGVVTRFVYDGERLIEERDAADALEESYLHGPGVDEVLSRRRISGGVASDLFYHTDALGSVVALTDSAGAVVERYRYGPFGRVTFLSPDFTQLTSSAVYNNLLFAGRYHDTESGLYDFRARSYHPGLGRFLQRDPLGEQASLNLYSYASGDPVNATDPSGMMTYALNALGQDMARLARRMGTGGGWSLQGKMSYRQGHYVDHLSASFATFEGAQAAEDECAWVDQQNQEWEAKRRRALAHSVREQLRESLDKSRDAMDHPKGVVVIFDGFGQSILEEHEGTQNRTELDTQADHLRSEGYVVLELNADDMATWFLGSEPSMEAVRLVADVVQAVSDNAGGQVPVSIEGFSRGGGPAVALTNELAARGVADSASIHTYLIDPYMGEGSNRIGDTQIGVQVYYSSRFSWVRPAGPMIGLGREIYSGFGPTRLPGSYLPVRHGQMDTYGAGVLGLIDNKILGY